MSIEYSVIEIFTSEEVRHDNTPLYDALINYVRDLKIAARCMLTKGTDACYENGELATQNILTLSFNMPLKIEIILPSSELNLILPDIEDMVYEGIVAVRQLSVCCHKTHKQLIPKQIRVRDIMTLCPEKVNISTPVSEVVTLLLSSIFTGVPVVNDDNHPIGIITQGDLICRAKMPIRLGLLASTDSDKIKSVLDRLFLKKAEEIMTSPALSIKSDEFIINAVNIMLKKKLKRLPVTDKSGRLTGMLSRLDIFQTITKESPDWDAIKKRNIIVGNLRFVSDIMRRDLNKVLPETSVEEVIRRIDSNDIQRVAVVDKDKKFIGLISDRDLLSAFSEHKAGIWEYFAGKLSFKEKRRHHKRLSKKLMERTAAEVMETDLITVTEETSIDEAIKLMTEKGFKRLPVVDPNGMFKGLISRDSLLLTGFVK
ncbi:Histidine kinase [Candidatus Magnetomoraceae bacterium gMMP-15]